MRHSPASLIRQREDVANHHPLTRACRVQSGSASAVVPERDVGAPSGSLDDLWLGECIISCLPSLSSLSGLFFFSMLKLCGIV